MGQAAIDLAAALVLVLVHVHFDRAARRPGQGNTLAAAAQPAARRGWVARIFASADDGNSPREWLKLAAPVLAGVLFSQMLNLGGCNTTPTQSRLGNAEEAIRQLQDFNKTLDAVFVPRKEIEHNAHTVENLQAQRDERIKRLEDEFGQITLFLMEGKR